MSFVFYDTETTGTETAFDQILQFAAIRTDADLNEIDRFEIRCRLLPHIVPAPGAMRVTGVRVSQLHDTTHCSHYEMVRQIRAKLLDWSPSVIIGYNSLDYDEHLLRQALYKTLHPPYLTNTNGNCRGDALRMVRATSIFEPDALIIPTDGSGKQSFKLDRVAPANGFDHAAAHDALADVQATIHLCRLIMERVPSIWSTFMRFSQKAAVTAYIQEERIFSLTEFYFGQGYSWLVTPIGTNRDNASEFYVYDLGIDPESLNDLDDDTLARRLGKSPKPVRRLRSNTSPFLLPMDEGPSFAMIGEDELNRRADILEGDEAFRNRLITALNANREEKLPSSHVEQQIYDGFWPKTDEFSMESFHAVAWEKRLSIVENLQDQRLKTIALNLIHIERPDLLHESVRTAYDHARVRRLLGADGTVPWLTLPVALASINAMLMDCDEAHRILLQEHRDHLTEWHDAMQVIITAPIVAA